jgi:hypothetical protein
MDIIYNDKVIIQAEQSNLYCLYFNGSFVIERYIPFQFKNYLVKPADIKKIKGVI